MSRERIKFEVKDFYDEEGFLRRGIFIDDEYFDWGVDEDSFKEALAMGPHYVRILQQDIERHFLESISEFMNRKVTAEEVNLARASGWIQK